jgi:hypothetical protein
MQKIKDILKIILGVAILVMFIGTILYVADREKQSAEAAYRQQLIQELCEREDYTFCEIDKIIYKERKELDDEI